MDLGVRQIRTAGKGSGSIELTLPSELRDLVGLPCRIILRDGSRPDLVLQPDLRAAHLLFSLVWQRLTACLVTDDADVPRFPVSAFDFGLQRRDARAEKPFLCWRDGLVLAGEPPHEPEAVARIISAQASALAERLEIGAEHANGFGAACGYLVAGVPAEADEQEARDLAAATLRETARLDDTATVEACAAGIGSDIFWQRAAPLLAATADLFAGWTNDPASYDALRAAWRRGRTIELNDNFAA
jgi:hypothetical protein